MTITLQYITHDLTGSSRGQGKRIGQGMVIGAMSARITKVRQLDTAATYGCTKEEAAEIALFDHGSFAVYHAGREAGMDHHQAAVAAYEAM